MKYVFRHDFDAFFRICSEGASEMALCDRHSRRKEFGSAPWSGTESFEEAVQLAISGCTNFEDQILRIAEKIVVEMDLGKKDIAPETLYSVSGDEVDLSRFLEGEPECMVTWQEKEITRPSGRIISIGAQSAVSWRVSATSILHRGAAMLAVALAAEKIGYRVELEVVYALPGVDKNNTSTICVRIKDADRPIDVTRAAFMLLHPAALRRMGFSYMENQNARYRETFAVYNGGSYSGDMIHAEQVFKETYSADIMLGSQEWEDFTSEEKATSWAIREMAKLTPE